MGKLKLNQLGNQQAEGLDVVINRIGQHQLIFYLAIFYSFILATFAVSAIDLSFSDDAYYYFTVARNVATGAGSTFDGVTVTTGYHPLWLGVLTALYYFFDDFKSFHFAIYVILTALFLFGHLFLARVAIQIGLFLPAFLVGSLLVFMANLSFFQHGVENSLVFFLLSLFLWMQCRSWQNRTIEIASFALVLLLLYFARLDGIFFIMLYLLWYMSREWRARNIGAAIVLPIVVLGVIGVHLLFMLITFDSIYPTSRLAISEVLAGGESSNLLQAFSPRTHQLPWRIKEVLEWAGLPLSTVAPWVPFRYFGLAVPISLILGVLIVARRDLRRRLPVVLVGLASMLELAYYALFLNGYTRPWYFTGWYILVAIAVGFLLSNVVRKLTFVWMILLVPVVAITILVVNFERKNVPWSYYAHESELLNKYNTGENILVGGTPDRAAYFSGVPIRHLEGLMNGYEYLQTYVKPRRIASYLADIKATHFVISSGSILPDYVPCSIEIARDSDGGRRAFGTYDRHNSYIAVYRVVVSSDDAGQNVTSAGPECGPAQK